MSDYDTDGENIAQTLARELPRPSIVSAITVGNPADNDTLLQIAIPKGFDLKEVDLERLLPNPRRTKAAATLNDPDSFLAYVARHATARTVCWAKFNPQTFTLAFTAVIDEHDKAAAGWRAHTASYTPDASAEWKVWSAANKQPHGQVEFAEFIERHEPDIAAMDGYPTSLQMLAMATEFEANSDKRIKSVARLQGGGVRLEYVDDDNDATLTQMKLFERFQIGIPVFWAGPGYRIDARLKYRHGSGKVSFWYELIRPDRVHEAAAKELIEKVRAGLGSVPLLMGNCA
ncbi:DUF2303 family protein [Pelomonas sp. Root1444]|uniref:DUF2303 family protein n=1 Tax=Pelomonas sp. Root1444 TaxID=1736464 RepID=UPI0007025C5D|nr:DUF2303 family protein [Pelomonas sp. Root1444]KQY83724.1 hypothetical protein ASD35_24185 [Pelomonas sp. Root1444]